MIEIQMSKDIRDFAPKLIGPFSTRQVLVILLAAAIVIPLLIFVPGEFFVRLIIATVLATPIVACGWVAPFGMPLEKFALQAIKVLLFTSSKRKYVSQNEFKEEYDKISPPAEPLKKTKKSKTIKSYR